MSDDFEHVGKIKEHFSRHRNQWSWLTINEGIRFYNKNNADVFTVVIPEKRIVSIVGHYSGTPFILVNKKPKNVVKQLTTLFS